MKAFEIVIFLLAALPGLIFAQEEGKKSRIVIQEAFEVNPWSGLDFQNNKENFQFAIVTDRTGGHRPGIFGNAVEKLNLLQPEFVMSVGDLIEGYTRDDDRIYREWEEFNTMIGKLEMPFFYVPGNHDYINDVMARIWEELYGASYYYFIYRDVLFLCLNSEEGMKGSNMGAIEEEQFKWIEKTLEENTDVRWTLVFMHQPLWILDNTGYWGEVEKLLSDRKHTVFVGHHHHYVKYTRNRGNYFMLATTGGISRLRGPSFGEFDHVVWVTMTDDGPIMANLLLEGIWDENVVTESLMDMIRADRLSVEPILVEDEFFRGSVLQIRITNDDNFPMQTRIRFEENDYLKPEIVEYNKTVEPNWVELLEVPLQVSRLKHFSGIEPLEFNANFTYTYLDGREIALDGHWAVKPVVPLPLMKAGGIRNDGRLDDWEELPVKRDPEAYVSWNEGLHYGPGDAGFSFNVVYDDEKLHLGMIINDDKLVFDPLKTFWDQDAVSIMLDSRDLRSIANGTGDNRNREYFSIQFIPSRKRREPALVYQPGDLPWDYELNTSIVHGQIHVELSMPLNDVFEYQGIDWRCLRVNIVYQDVDEGNMGARLWWQPDWSSDKNFIGSGIFERR